MSEREWEGDVTYSSPLGAAGCLADYAFGCGVVGRHDDGGEILCLECGSWRDD